MRSSRILPPLLAALCAAGAAHALDAPLTATHRVVAVEQNADGQTTLTLDVTARNTSAESLSAVTLLPLPGMTVMAAPDAEPLVIGPVDAGQSASALWSVPVMGPAQAGSPLLQRLTFAGEAHDAAGELLTFPVDSQEVTP